MNVHDREVARGFWVVQEHILNSSLMNVCEIWCGLVKFDLSYTQVTNEIGLGSYIWIIMC